MLCMEAKDTQLAPTRSWRTHESGSGVQPIALGMCLMPGYSVFKVHEVGRFSLRRVPLGKLSLHLVGIEKGQFVALKLKFFKNLVILLILILIVGRDTP